MKDTLVQLLQVALFFGGFGLPYLLGNWWPTQFVDARAPIDASPDKQRDASARWSAYHSSGQALGVLLCIGLWVFTFWAVPRIFY